MVNPRKITGNAKEEGEEEKVVVNLIINFNTSLFWWILQFAMLDKSDYFHHIKLFFFV